MYKNSQDSLDYIDRVGSHSTRGRRSGHVDILPPEAKELEHEYQSFKECIGILTTELMKVQKRLENGDKREHLKARHGHLKDLLGDAKRAARLAGKCAYAEAFYAVARLTLPQEVFTRCCKETNELMGRPEIDFKMKGTKGSKEAATRKGRLRNRRIRLRARMERLGV